VGVIIGAQLGCALSLGLAGFVSNSLWLIPPLLLSTLSISCIRPASAALIAELTPRHQRARAFSLGHLGTNLGFSIGPLLAGFLFKRAPEWIFWGDGLTTALSSLIVWRALRGYTPHTHEEPAHDPSSTPSAPSTQTLDLEAAVEGSVWGVLRARPQLLMYAGLSLLTAMGYAQITFSLPITLSALVGESSADVFGWVMSGNGLFVLLLTPLLTFNSDHTPHLKALARGALLFALGFGVLALGPALLPIALGVSWPLYTLLALSVALWTAGEVYTFNHGSAFVAQETPSSHRGRVNGALPLIIGLTRSLAPLLSGALMAHINLQSLWLLIGTLSFCASLGFVWMRVRLGEGR
jgi:MFS family permease